MDPHPGWHPSSQQASDAHLCPTGGGRGAQGGANTRLGTGGAAQSREPRAWPKVPLAQWVPETWPAPQSQNQWAWLVMPPALDGGVMIYEATPRPTAWYWAQASCPRGLSQQQPRCRWHGPRQLWPWDAGAPWSFLPSPGGTRCGTGGR